MSSVRSLYLFAACAALLGAFGCAAGEATHEKARAPTPAPGPPNAVMLDYMTPEDLAHSKQLEHQSAAPLPGTIGEKEPPPRIRQTVVIGRNNPDPVWEMDHPNAGGYDDPGAESRGLADPPTYRSGPTFYYRGRGGGGGSPGPLPGAPHVGGDWPSAPNYGPKQMR